MPSARRCAIGGRRPVDEMIKAAKGVATAAWPRREEFESGRFYGWRVIIAMLASYATVGITMHLAWAFGFVTVLGTSGLDYAKAADLEPMRKAQTELASRLDQRSNDIMGVVIGGQIFDLQFKKCSAVKAGNPDLVRAYSDQLQGTLDQYQHITGRSYYLQACP